MIKEINSEIEFHELPFHLDLKGDDVVFISSDIKNFALAAKNQGKKVDLDLFISNLQKILKNGTIVIPAYTDYLKNGDTFDYYKSKPSTGAISNKVFKRKDFVRTEDPIHSVFFWGENSSEILSLNDKSTFGKNSIFSFLHKNNAKFIFLDVHIVNSFTFVHYVEEYLKVPYRSYLKWNIHKIKEKKTEENVLFHTKKPGVVTDFDDLNKTFYEEEFFRLYNYYKLPINVISAKNAVEVIEKKIIEKKHLYYFSWKEYLKFYVKKLLNNIHTK